MKYILLIGIGGSSLGAKAVYDALRKPHQSPKLIIADTVSPVTRERIVAQLAAAKKEEVTIVYVSKSGTTLESKENFEFFKKYAGTIVDVYKDLDFDKTIGGRFSVLTEVGLYPLRLCGFDTDAMLKGRDEADEEAAKQSAQWLFEQMQAGWAVHDMFLFNPELESLGKWYRQLMGESTGKDGRGFYPTVSIGSTDLHSTFQRTIAGPKNVATTFVFARHSGDKTMAALYKATLVAYHNHGLPFSEYAMPKLDEYELGKFLQMKMREIIHLAHLMGVNPYDQPAVEEYKAEARRLLTSG